MRVSIWGRRQGDKLVRRFGEHFWVFDGECVPFFGLPFPTRMCVVRLNDGALWIHSPIALSDELKEQVKRLGDVKYLIAPNHLHHLFLPEWCSAFPEAQVYGTDELIKKRRDIEFDFSLNEARNWPWKSEIDQLMFTGSPLLQECIFFHKQTELLLVTDLVENMPGDNFNVWQKWVARGAGILAPHGKMPLEWRLSFMFSKSQAQKHLKRILDWDPKILIMSHGNIVEKDTVDFICRSFRWLIK